MIEFPTTKLAWWLGGPATVIHIVTYKPILIGSGGMIDPVLLQPQTMTLVSSGFITAWKGWMMIAAAIVAFAAWIAHKIHNYRKHLKHKKNHHKESSNN